MGDVECVDTPAWSWSTTFMIAARHEDCSISIPATLPPAYCTPGAFTHRRAFEWLGVVVVFGDGMLAGFPHTRLLSVRLAAPPESGSGE